MSRAKKEISVEIKESLLKWLDEQAVGPEGLSDLVEDALEALRESTREVFSREVFGNTVVSSGEPEVTIEVDGSLRYVGRDRFILFGVAQAELFIFAEERDGVVERMLWIQFEGYMDNNGYHYTYPPEPKERLGAHDYVYSTNLRRVESWEEIPDTDASHVVSLLSGEGLKLEKEFIFHRFVRTLDDSRRKELMIIYLEGLSVASYSPENFHWDRSTPLELTKEMHRRALESFTILEG